MAQVALRLRTNNTAAVVRPRLENRPHSRGWFCLSLPLSPSSFLYLSFSITGETGLVPPDYDATAIAGCTGESLGLWYILAPGKPRLSPAEIVESLKMATRQRKTAREGGGFCYSQCDVCLE